MPCCWAGLLAGALGLGGAGAGWLGGAQALRIMGAEGVLTVTTGRAEGCRGMGRGGWAGRAGTLKPARGCMYTIWGTWGSAGKRSTECVGRAGGPCPAAAAWPAAGWLGGLVTCPDDLKVGSSARQPV